jgi:hypothetical protein
MNSKFLLVKTLICLANIDQLLHPLEKKFIQNLIKKYNFSSAEILNLQNEMNYPESDYLVEFKKIDSYFERGEVLSFARHMFHVDDDFHPQEKIAYDKMVLAHNQLSGDISETSEDAAKSIVIEEKDKELYRELHRFGNVLNKRRSVFFRVWSRYYPSILIFTLLNEGGYAKKLAISIVVLVICYFVYSSSFS